METAIPTPAPALDLGLPLIRQHAEPCNRLLCGHLGDYRLKTALQPIYSLAHKRVVGYEALLRAADARSNPVSPAALFGQERSAGEMVMLDRLCRYIHIHNFLQLEDGLNWLFLNVSPETIIHGKKHGSFFSSLLDSFEFPAHRIVIEVVEQPMLETDALVDTIEYYKHLGCLIAIDDFGAGHSNFDRIWTLQPDIVKLDRSFLLGAAAGKTNRDMMAGIVSLLHQAGALVLMEGIETRDQALTAIDSDVDFVQGFYWGRPFTDIHPDIQQFDGFEGLLTDYKKQSARQERDFHEKLTVLEDDFTTAVSALKRGETLDTAATHFFIDPQVVRCYLIGADGLQVGRTIVSPFYETHQDPRFKPLEDAKSADWFRRHYLKRAMLHPGQLQVTRPYLSITGAHMCVTLSKLFSHNDRKLVLCCDLAV